LLWSEVASERIIEFLAGYRTHPDAHKVNSGMLAEFIQKMNATGELKQWTVAIIGGGKGRSADVGNGVRVDTLQRKGAGHEDRYSIGRLLSPRDEAIDLDELHWEEALRLTREAWHADPARLQQGREPDIPSGPSIRRVRGTGISSQATHQPRGLFLIYLLDSRREWTGLPEGSPDVAAIALSFPGSESQVRVEYKVNNILWEQEYGPGQ
jgi:hypothetical protein